jgi:histidinol-phosphate/aromatic aminotransferase/cobyric acid decarboxylase-like protein
MENAGEVAQRMLEAGIGVRSFRNLPGIGNALRVTMAPWPMIEEFLDVLKTVAT